MPTIHLPYQGGTTPTYVAGADVPGPRPGVVVIHDATGMGPEIRRQADWFADHGYLAVVPDLFGGTSLVRCLPSVVRDYLRREGAVFARIDAARGWVATHERGTGRVGLAGFCLGGDFALLVAPSGGYQVAAVSYGRVPRDAAALLRASCPVVASYGGRDRSLRGAAARLESVLEVAGVPHDVKEYPGAGHGFINDYLPGEIPRSTQVLGRLMHAGFDAPSAEDARRRILAFFEAYLR